MGENIVKRRSCKIKVCIKIYTQNLLKAEAYVRINLYEFSDKNETPFLTFITLSEAIHRLKFFFMTNIVDFKI